MTDDNVLKRIYRAISIVYAKPKIAYNTHQNEQLLLLLLFFNLEIEKKTTVSWKNVIGA